MNPGWKPAGRYAASPKGARAPHANAGHLRRAGRGVAAASSARPASSSPVAAGAAEVEYVLSNS